MCDNTSQHERLASIVEDIEIAPEISWRVAGGGRDFQELVAELLEQRGRTSAIVPAQG